MEGNLKGNYLRLRGQNELVGKFKMAANDMVRRGQVMEYTYVPTGIKRE